MKQPTVQELADALRACANAIEQELDAAGGADEIKQNATLRTHDKAARKARQLLSRLRAPDSAPAWPGPYGLCPDGTPHMPKGGECIKCMNAVTVSGS